MVEISGRCPAYAFGKMRNRLFFYFICVVLYVSWEPRRAIEMSDIHFVFLT